MSKIIGNAVLIFADEVAIGCTTSGSVTIEGTEIETTCKDDNGAYSSIIGSDRWTAEASGNWETAATIGVPELLALKKNKTLIGFKMAVVTPGTTTEAGTYFIGYAYIQSLTINSDLNAPANFSLSFSGSGDWNYGTTT
jgi:hypothetical protein